MAYPIPKSYLEDRPVLLRPPLGYFGVVGPEFKKAAKQRQTGDFWEPFDLVCIGAEEDVVCKVGYGQRGRNNDRQRHSVFLVMQERMHNGWNVGTKNYTAIADLYP